MGFAYVSEASTLRVHPRPLSVTPTGAYACKQIFAAICPQILSRPRTRVVAAARPADDCSELQALSSLYENRMMVVPLELSDFDSIQV